MNSGSVLPGKAGFTSITLGTLDNAHNRRGVADEIEAEPVIERRIDCVRNAGEQNCIAIRCGRYHEFGGDIGAGARFVLDDELLSKSIRQPLAHQACDDVIAAAGGKPDDQAHWPRRIAFRPGGTWKGREDGCSGGQMQKGSAGKFHGYSSWRHCAVLSATARTMPVYVASPTCNLRDAAGSVQC